MPRIHGAVPEAGPVYNAEGATYSGRRPTSGVSGGLYVKDVYGGGTISGVLHTPGANRKWTERRLKSISRGRQERINNREFAGEKPANVILANQGISVL